MPIPLSSFLFLSLSTQTKPTSTFSFSSNFTSNLLLKLHPLLLLRSKLKTKTLSFYKPNSSSSSSSSSSSTSSSPSQALISILRAIPDWADRVKERGVLQNRTLYDHHKWVHHRSSLRHVLHFFSSLSSRVVLSLVPPVIAFTAFAAAIAGYNSLVLVHWLPEFFPVLRASSLSYQLTAPALALLLVFRTEAAYARFVEGKKAWTRVIAAVHDFARLAKAGVENAADLPIKRALLQYIVAFPVVLKCHVMYGSDVRRDLQHLLELNDLEVVVNSKHPPRCIIEFISQSLRQLKLEDSTKNVLVGVLIEEPFPMLALDDLCKKAHKDIQEAIAIENLIKAQLVAKRNSHSEEQSPNGRPNS